MTRVTESVRRSVAALGAVLVLGGMATTALALTVGVVGLGYYANPIRTGDAVVGNGIFNTLLVASAAPSITPSETAPAASTRVRKNGNSG